MSLIIKNKIQELMQGYPTISDKYDVAPAVLDGESTAVKAGQLVSMGTTAGRYTNLKTGSGITTAALAQIAGFVLATNVKVPNTYPASTADQTYVAGDAFNLMIRGFIAVPLGAKFVDDTNGATERGKVKNGVQLAVFLDGPLAGQMTYHGATDGETSAKTAVDVPGAYFTGLTEVVDGVCLAEICYNL